MKSKADKIEYLGFIIVFAISCFTMSRQSIEGEVGYFYFNDFKFQLFKMGLVFFSVLLMTIINRNNFKQTSIFTAVFINFTIVIYTIDYFVTKFSGYLSFFRLWWLATIFVACFAYYIGCHFNETDNRKVYLRKFWLSFIPVYLISFFIIFIRTPADNLTTNLKIGKGMLQFIPYLMRNIGDSEIWFNVLGNLMFFIPIPFIVQALVPKIKTYQVFIVGILIPFFVEGYQYIFKCGDVDVDDIIMNVCGIIIGLLLLKADELILNKIDDKSKKISS